MYRGYNGEKKKKLERANLRILMHSISSNRKNDASRRTTESLREESTERDPFIYIYRSPYEVLAVAAEGGLLEEPWHEAVILDHVDIFLLESSLPAPQLLGESGVVVAGPEGVLARVVVRHGAAAADVAADRRSIDDVRSYTREARRLGTPASPRETF